MRFLRILFMRLLYYYGSTVPCEQSVRSNSSTGLKFVQCRVGGACIEVQKKKKKVFGHVFTSSTKREIRHFHVVVVQ